MSNVRSRSEKFVSVLDEAVLTANSTMFSTRGKVNQILDLVTTGFSGTIEFYASISEDAPDLDVAASVTNTYFAVEAKDRNDDAQVAGTTGLTLTTDTAIKAYGLNVNAITWFGVKMTRTAGSVTMRAIATDNS